MTLSLEDEKFLAVAVAAVPRVAEIIASFPAQHRAGALVVAERQYMQAADEFGCSELAARRWVVLVMHNLRTKVNHQGIDQQDLEGLLRRLAQSVASRRSSGISLKSRALHRA